MGTEPFDLSGRRALVTGASRGIGLVLARGLAAAGAKGVLNGRHPETLAVAAAGLPGAEILPFDVGDHAAARAAVDRFEAGSGAIDILVNNAACSTGRRWKSSRRWSSSGCSAST